MTQVKFLIGDIKDLHKLDKDKPKSNVPKRNNDVSKIFEKICFVDCNDDENLFLEKFLREIGFRTKWLYIRI